jgi:hypothetical protein
VEIVCGWCRSRVASSCPGVTLANQDCKLLKTGCSADSIATKKRHVRNTFLTRTGKVFVLYAYRVVASGDRLQTIKREWFLVVMF